jgi:hypothetical protein
VAINKIRERELAGISNTTYKWLTGFLMKIL